MELENILKKHFKSTKRAAFERQLYYYGFKKIRNKQKVEFQHSKIQQRKVGVLRREKTRQRESKKQKEREGLQQKTDKLKAKYEALLRKVEKVRGDLDKMEEEKTNLTNKTNLIETERTIHREEFKADSYISVSLLINSFNIQKIISFFSQNAIFKHLNLEFKDNYKDNYNKLVESINHLITTNQRAKREFLKVVRDISFAESNDNSPKRKHQTTNDHTPNGNTSKLIRAKNWSNY